MGSLAQFFCLAPKHYLLGILLQWQHDGDALDVSESSPQVCSPRLQWTGPGQLICQEHTSHVPRQRSKSFKLLQALFAN